MTTTDPGPTVPQLLGALADTGRDRQRGGYSRHLFTGADTTMREWFTAEALARGLDVERDRNGNLWAWWRPAGVAAGERAVVTGSHLDSVPGGGAFDGVLGVVSALRALDLLRAAGVQPRRPLALVVWAEEEGGRFGVACLGSRLLTGFTDPDAARALRDPDGVPLAQAAGRAGLDPDRLGPEPERLAGIECFVELHVEQGRGLIDLGEPLALGSTVLANGRWRISFTGEANHAGATPMGARSDPLLPAAETVLAARRAAAAAELLRATIGRVLPHPGGTNVISDSVDLWLDARGPDDAATSALVEDITAAAHEAAAREGCGVEVLQESVNPAVHLDAGLRERMHRSLTAGDTLAGLDAGSLPVPVSVAGHDAAVVGAARPARVVPTGMLFVRNPTGVSHSPAEHAEDVDCERGASALATVLTDLLG